MVNIESTKTKKADYPNCDKENTVYISWGGNNPSPRIRIKLNCPCTKCRVTYLGCLTLLVQESKETFKQFKEKLDKDKEVNPAI